MMRNLQLSLKDLQLYAREATSLFDLSDDNFGEIFSRLPVRSLLICECVCKRFSNVITNPKFRAIHVNRAITSNTTTFCSVFLCGRNEIDGGGSNETDESGSDETDESGSNETDESGSNEIDRHRYDHILLENTDTVSFSYVRLSNPISCEISIICSCNGLFCAELKAPSDQNESCILIWNPVTRENRYVAKPKVNASGIATTLALAFGFTRETNDYKVVRIVSYYSSEETLMQQDDVVIKLEVYKMSTDNWSTYKVTNLPSREPDYLHPQVDPIILHNICCPHITRSLRGAFHWLTPAPGDVGRAAKAIVSFDIQEEELKLFTVLDPRKIPDVELGILDSLNDSLSLIVPHYMSPYSTFDLWVMSDYGNRKSWTKQFTVDQFRGLARPIGYWKDDLFLMAKMIMGDRFLCLYNLRTQEMKFFPVMWLLSSATFCDYAETFETVSRVIAVEGEAVSEGPWMAGAHALSFVCIILSSPYDGISFGSWILFFCISLTYLVVWGRTV